MSGKMFYAHVASAPKAECGANIKEVPDIDAIMRKENKPKVNSYNNGGKTDYYQLHDSNFPILDADDFAEFKEMNWAQGSMLKVVWTFNSKRHSGTNYVRDLNKLIHYANRELLRLSRED